MWFKRRKKSQPSPGAFFPEDVDVWGRIATSLNEAPWPVEVLPARPDDVARVMHQLELTTDSELGALVGNTGGLVLAHGGVTLLGAGHGLVPDVAAASPFMHDPTTYITLGYDVIGGLFAIDGGALDAAPGQICYFDPAALRWQDLNVSHTQFMQWVLSADLDRFYAPYRGPGTDTTWQEELTQLPAGHGFALTPPPHQCSVEELALVPRTTVTLPQLWRTGFNAAGFSYPTPDDV